MGFNATLWTWKAWSSGLYVRGKLSADNKNEDLAGWFACHKPHRGGQTSWRPITPASFTGLGVSYDRGDLGAVGRADQAPQRDVRARHHRLVPERRLPLGQFTPLRRGLVDPRWTASTSTTRCLRPVRPCPVRVSGRPELVELCAGHFVAGSALGCLPQHRGQVPVRPSPGPKNGPGMFYFPDASDQTVWMAP